MIFHEFIEDIFDQFIKAWNVSDIEAVKDLLDDDIMLITPGITLGGSEYQAQEIYGREEVMRFLKSIRRNLPLKLQKVNFVDKETDRNNTFKVHYYQIGVWRLMECTLSQYGKFEKLVVSPLSHSETKSLNPLIIFKNVLSFHLGRLIGR